MLILPPETAKVESISWFAMQEKCSEIAHYIFATETQIIQFCEDHVLVWDTPFA